MHVEDLGRSIGFYSKLFGAEPSRVEPDYAKWMIEDPPVNFAISSRGGEVGLDPLGFQTDDPAELAAMKTRAEAADLALLDEGETTCCYARSEKHWIADPQGVAWEHFHTLDAIPVFSEATAADAAVSGTSTCCAPAAEARASACRSPAADAQKSAAFLATAVTLERRIELVLALPLRTLAGLGLQRELDDIGKAGA
jgi:lactoylglutathione lyase